MLETTGCEEGVIVKEKLHLELGSCSDLSPVEARASLAWGGSATALLLVSPLASMFQLPAFMAAFLQSLKVLVRILSCFKISVALWTPLFNIDRVATLMELLRCSCLRFLPVVHTMANC